MPQQRYFYQLYSKVISSDFSIPGAYEIPPDNAPDLVIRLKRSTLKAKNFHLLYTSIHSTDSGDPLFKFFESDDQFVFSYPGLADYALVKDLTEIHIHLHQNSEQKDVLYFLLKGAILTLWLNLSNIICLHSSAITIEGKAIGFIGQSLAGKSTIAEYSLSKGVQLVSDDILAINPKFLHGGNCVMPSIPLLKTRNITQFNNYASNTELPINCPGKKERLIDILKVSRSSWQPDPLPLKKLYILDRQSPNFGIPKVQELSANEKLVSLIVNTQAGLVFEKSDQLRPRMTELSMLVMSVPIVLLSYSSGLDKLEELMCFIKQDCTKGTIRGS